ncbi:MAG: N-6 DNA methylase [Gammaproteobacteria bacterium]|nr:N-6 DNA methylase [Gammaproteobacteria bacterium]
MASPDIHAYLKAVAGRLRHGGATEHSYRGDLETLMRALLPGVAITNEPSRVECGAPDYVLTRNTIPLGYIEAKDVDKSLDDRAHREQLQRYLRSLDNFAFTNYLEFRFYRDNETKPVADIAIAELRDGKIKPLPQNFAQFSDLVENFGAYQGRTIATAADLARRMADKARMLARVITAALTTDERHDGGVSEEDSELRNQLEAFRQTLIADIEPAEFADIYAQTVAYGMFAARLHDPTPATFTRQEAAELIPKSNPFLRNLFQHIAGYELDSRIRWIVDDLADVFRASAVHELMKAYGKATQQNDPFLHFYETFLGAYDAKLRKSRGVWYTPEPVVNFIARAVDAILKKEFGLRRGLADSAKITVGGRSIHRVQILDPAAGTGTFLANIVKHIHESFHGQRGVWPDYARDDLIPRLHGFEILMAPYAMAHVKLEMILNETGCKLRDGQRLRVFLTDSLENRAAKGQTRELPFARWLANEARGADKVKRDTPVMVVVGNPPYNVKSKNRGKWILDLLKAYKKDLGEKKLNLDDDYIKFIRYGEWLVEKTGEGVLAYISNNSFIDGVTHRQMRHRLLETFDRIYILDLHGDSRKKERSPDGSPDKNVFDIMQGVSINIFVKTGKKQNGALGDVFHCDLFGARESKYEFLWNHGLDMIDFQKLEMPSPYFFFAPKDFSAQAAYEKGFSVKELFPVFNSGVKTDRDPLFINRDKDALSKNIKQLLSGNMDNDFVSEYLIQDSSGYKLTHVIQGKEYNPDHVVGITYRPFDSQWIYYDREILSRPAYKAMRHMLAGENFGLMTSRSYPTTAVFDRILVTHHIADIHAASDQTYFFPLYLYPDEKQTRIGGETSRKPNLNTDIIKTIADKLGLRFTPEKTDAAGTFAPLDLLDYIYAVLHSPAYRKKFREFLKIDFPRVPYPRDKKQFRALARLGAELRTLHLMESAKLDKLITTYPQTGDNTITAIKFEAGKVWINKTQHFAQVPKAAWDFHIGGYQPAQKYLKDRKNRSLTPDEIRHYQKIIVALAETAKVMQKIDKL